MKFKAKNALNSRAVTMMARLRTDHSRLSHLILVRSLLPDIAPAIGGLSPACYPPRKMEDAACGSDQGCRQVISTMRMARMDGVLYLPPSSNFGLILLA